MRYEDYIIDDVQQERIDNHAKELLLEDNYNCNLFENFSLDLYSASVEDAESIEYYLTNRDFEKLGRLVWSISYETRKKMADVQAKDDFENGKL